MIFFYYIVFLVLVAGIFAAAILVGGVAGIFGGIRKVHQDREKRERDQRSFEEAVARQKAEAARQAEEDAAFERALAAFDHAEDYPTYEAWQEAFAPALKDLEMTDSNEAGMRRAWAEAQKKKK